MTEEEKKWYHDHVTANKEEISKSGKCGCASCVRIFDASEVTWFCKDSSGETAVCPYCYVDALIGDACGKPVTKSMLRKFNREMF